VAAQGPPRPGEGDTPTADFAGEFYSKLIEDQLAEERARKASLEQRAGGVITTSGAVVTLVFGFTAVVKGSTALHIPDTARLELLVAVVLLLIAVAMALVIGLPRTYLEVEKEGLDQMVTENAWINPEAVEARRTTAEANVGIILSARGVNATKATLLSAAFVLEVLGIVSLALSAMAILLTN
jgi:hypothetical protein